MAIVPAPEWTSRAMKVFGPNAFGPSALVRHAAFVRDLRVNEISRSFSVISDGERQIGFWGNLPQTTTLVAHRAAASTRVRSSLLTGAGLAVPAGRAFPVTGYVPALKFAKELGFPVTVGPVRGAGSTHSPVKVDNEADFEAVWPAVSAARIRVGEHLAGETYRLYLIGDRVVAGLQVVPPFVNGDAKHTVAELIARKNEVRRLNPYLGAYLITPSAGLRRSLADAGLSLESVPEAHHRVVLNPVASLRAGGDSIDVTTQVHADFQDIAARARRALRGVVNLAVDVVADDISAPARRGGWAISGLDTSAEPARHHFPAVGSSRDVAGQLIEHLFPGSRLCDPSEYHCAGVTITTSALTRVGREVQSGAGLRGLVGWARRTGEVVEAVFNGAPHAVESMVSSCRLLGVAENLPIDELDFAEAEDFHILAD